MDKSRTWPLENRRELARWAHACICFENCLQACDLMLKQKIDIRAPLYKPLTVWAVIEYAKPFMKNKVIPSVPKTIVNKSQCELHAFLIRFRNKVAVHLDSESGTGQEIHTVRFELNDTGGSLIVEEPKFPPNRVPQLKSLARQL